MRLPDFRSFRLPDFLNHRGTAAQRNTEKNYRREQVNANMGLPLQAYGLPVFPSSGLSEPSLSAAFSAALYGYIIKRSLQTPKHDTLLPLPLFQVFAQRHLEATIKAGLRPE
jgi:hypothetical protein